jgi:hypothetical protein
MTLCADSHFSEHNYGYYGFIYIYSPYLTTPVEPNRKQRGSDLTKCGEPKVPKATS